MSKSTVTVSVLTYNSSKTVLETLNSIKEQTYPNLILQICDDCSSDNTIQICEKWIEENKGRFVKTKFILSERNTGTAANCNRSWDSCETEWIKDIAADDVLLPECIEELMMYISQHKDAVCVFGKIKCFGPDVSKAEKIENFYNNNFFKMSNDEQLERLLTIGNYIPAPSCICNIIQLRKIGIRHDERIPLLEDLPKWINMLKAGVRLHFVEKEVVLYRVGSGVSTIEPSINYRLSINTYNLYYTFPYKYERNPEEALIDLVKHESNLIQQYYNIKNSTSMKIGAKIVNTIRYLTHLLKRK